MSDILGKKIAKELRAFAECDHRSWQCTKCKCKTDRSTLQHEGYRKRHNEVVAAIQKYLDMTKHRERRRAMFWLCDELGIAVQEGEA